MRRCPVAVPFLYRCCPVAVRIAVCVAVPPASRLGSHPSSPQRFRMGVAVSLRVPILSRFAVHRCDGNGMLIAHPPVSVCVPSLSASVYRWPHGPDRNARICRALRCCPLSRFVSLPYPPRAAVLSFLIYLSRRCPVAVPLPSRVGSDNPCLQGFRTFLPVSFRVPTMPSSRGCPFFPYISVPSLSASLSHSPPEPDRITPVCRAL